MRMMFLMPDKFFSNFNKNFTMQTKWEKSGIIDYNLQTRYKNNVAKLMVTLHHYQ